MSDYAEQVEPERQAWKQSVPSVCMICHSTHKDCLPLQIHEIERRAQAPLRWGHPCNYLLVGNLCHMKLGGYYWPHERQLAAKMLGDFEHFDLAAWLRIGDPELKAPNRITMAEIIAHMRLKQLKQ